MSKTYKGVGGMELPNEAFPARITKGYYRVLEENTEGAAELGAYRLLANAIKTCDENPGSCVMADAGVCIYSSGTEGTGQDDTEPVCPDDGGHSGPDSSGNGSDDSGDSDSGGDTGNGEGADDGNMDKDSDSPAEPAEIVGYAKLKTLMNVRTTPSSDGGLVRTYKEDTIVAVVQFCDNGWMCISCEETASGLAYISNEGGKYASTGKSLYVVKKDDNLWKIAEEQLGDGSRYKEISEINFLVSNRIKVGMALILPEAILTAEE